MAELVAYNLNSLDAPNAIPDCQGLCLVKFDLPSLQGEHLQYNII